MSRTGPTLRPWQRHALDRMKGWEDGSFLVSAAPGAGKTIPALVFAAQELRAGRALRMGLAGARTAAQDTSWATIGAATLRAYERHGLLRLPLGPRPASEATPPLVRT